MQARFIKTSVAVKLFTSFVLGILILPVYVEAQVSISATVNAGVNTASLEPLWGDHYDLMLELDNYFSDPAFLPVTQALGPRYWRCSIGRWEITRPGPPGGGSADTNVLKNISTEFYRGANNMVDADDPTKYSFTYLDAQLNKIIQTGAEPYLCLDYMPFTLSSIRYTGNPYDSSANPAYIFSNGIRTAPPADSAVYARVVHNVIRHVRGQFAGTQNFGINYIEIGNEPDLSIPLFWTSNAGRFYNMYKVVAAEVNNDPLLSPLIKLGAGSFAFIDPDTTFAKNFLINVAANNTRLDFLSYHSYHDSLAFHFQRMMIISQMRNTYKPGAALINGEWGADLGSANIFFDRVQHGLFRTKVMMLMQLFRLKMAHESVYRNLGTIPGEPGLIFAFPARNKPAADVYLALTKMNDCLNGIQVTAPSGEYMMAGKKSDNSKICIVYVADSLQGSITKTVQLQVNNLPWSGTYYAYRYMVSDSTWSAGLGVYLVSAQILSGSTFSSSMTYGPGPGKGRLAVWVLSTSPQGIDPVAGYMSGQISIFPNPFHKQTKICINPLLLQNGSGLSFHLYDMLGKEVKTVQAVSAPEFTLESENLCSGLYLFRLCRKNALLESGKLIIE